MTTAHNHTTAPKVVICTPVAPDGYLHHETTAWLLRIAQRRPPWYAGWLSACSPYIPTNRNELVVQALAAPDVTHILWLDSDVVPPDDAVDRLLAGHKEIIGGIVPNLLPQNTDNVIEPGWMIVPQGEQTWRRWQHRPEGFVQCHALATAFLVVSIEVFRHIRPPWFAQDDQTPEDVFFSERAREHGYSLWADCSITCRHFKINDLVEIFKAARDPFFQRWLNVTDQQQREIP